MSAYERYAGWIQDYIYRKGWQSTREIQDLACDAILDHSEHVLLSSATASGKTEAAFLPALTLLEHNPSKSVGILYISPLKALINDQHVRLADLCRSHHIDIWPWHGDVSADLKQRAVEACRGIVQMTPESLEAMLMRNPKTARKLFGDLRFVIIDEVHAFLASERGAHLQNLLVRLERICGRSFRRIGLSATLASPDSASAWLSAGTNRPTIYCAPQAAGRKVSLCLQSYEMPVSPEERQKTTDAWRMFLYSRLKGQKAIVFTNNRGQSEETAYGLKQIAKERQEEDRYLVHHGSLNARVRRAAEMEMKREDRQPVVCATVTLELGIDIGDLDLIAEIGAPWTVSSFVQRLGRSGRSGGPAKLLMIALDDQSLSELSAFAMPWDFLQMIAITELYHREHFIEDTPFLSKPFSLLAHQSLAVLETYHQLKANELAAFVLSLPAFKGRITADEYRILLRHMLETRILEQDETGHLFVGLAAEHLVSDWRFYSVFQTKQSWRVLFKGREIGEIDSDPELGVSILMSGKVWRICGMDENKKTIQVEPGERDDAILFSGGIGFVDPAITRMVKTVLAEESVYPYLTKQAAKELEAARKSAREGFLLEKPDIVVDENFLFLNFWLPEKEIRTLARLFKKGWKERLKIRDVYAGRYAIGVLTDLSRSDFLFELKLALRKGIKASDLYSRDSQLQVCSYDNLVPKELLERALMADTFCLDTFEGILQTLDAGEAEKSVAAEYEGEEELEPDLDEYFYLDDESLDDWF